MSDEQQPQPSDESLVGEFRGYLDEVDAVVDAIPAHETEVALAAVLDGEGMLAGPPTGERVTLDFSPYLAGDTAPAEPGERAVIRFKRTPPPPSLLTGPGYLVIHRGDLGPGAEVAIGTMPRGIGGGVDDWTVGTIAEADGMTAPAEGELGEVADSLDRAVEVTQERLAGGELERRREEIMARVRAGREADPAG